MDVNTANQSTTDEQMMDILLVLDKEKKTISAVKGVDENGELQTVPPEDNSELLKFDRHGDFFSCCSFLVSCFTVSGVTR